MIMSRFTEGSRILSAALSKLAFALGSAMHTLGGSARHKGEQEGTCASLSPVPLPASLSHVSSLPLLGRTVKDALVYIVT